MTPLMTVGTSRVVSHPPQPSLAHGCASLAPNPPLRRAFAETSPFVRRSLVTPRRATPLHWTRDPRPTEVTDAAPRPQRRRPARLRRHHRRAAAEPELRLQGLFCNAEDQLDRVLALMGRGLDPQRATAAENRDAVVCTYVDRLRFVLRDPVRLGEDRRFVPTVKYEATPDRRRRRRRAAAGVAAGAALLRDAAADRRDPGRAAPLRLSRTSAGSPTPAGAAGPRPPRSRRSGRSARRRCCRSGRC